VGLLIINPQIREVDMQRQKTPGLKRGLIFLVCLVALVGWFGAPAVQAQDHGSMMKDSGFKQWNVDTLNEKTFFDKHPQGKLITYKKADKVIHVFKDPTSGVVLSGDPADLQSYYGITKAQGMSPVDREDAADQSDPDFWQNWEDEYGP
jgi:hypothetical protein